MQTLTSEVGIEQSHSELALLAGIGDLQQRLPIPS
jgi:hypothetical protein